MGKRLSRLTRDGESRVIAPQGVNKNIRCKVIAVRIDADTPYVILRMADGKEYSFEDVYAEELCARINVALSILPTSK